MVKKVENPEDEKDVSKNTGVPDAADDQGVDETFVKGGTREEEAPEVEEAEAPV